MVPNMKSRFLSLSVATVLMAACGESDLPEEHQEALAEERLRLEQAALAAALPAGAEDTLDASTEESVNATIDSGTAGVGTVVEGTDQQDNDETGSISIAEVADVENVNGDSEAAPETPAGSVANVEPVEAPQAGSSAVQDLDLQNDFTLVFADEFDGDELDLSQGKQRWSGALNYQSMARCSTTSMPSQFRISASIRLN